MLQYFFKKSEYISMLFVAFVWCMPASAQTASSLNQVPATGNLASTDSLPKEEELMAQLEKQVFDLINLHRAKKGLTILQWSDAVYDPSLQFSTNMAQKTAPFSHEGFENRIAEVTAALALPRPRYVAASAENIAYGDLTAEKVVAGWIKSKGHKKNLEGDYTHSAVGIEKDANGILYFTQIFIKIK